MPEPMSSTMENPHEAFRQYERSVRIHNYRIACILALIFMPAGTTLDWVVYPDQWLYFLGLRMFSAVLLGFIWWFVKTPLGLKNLWILGQIVAGLPSFFISWMIYYTEGARSPYYAGINLVLLGTALILRWSLLDSIVVILSAIGMYLGACWLHGFSMHDDSRIVFNNLYFLFVTGTFVVIGNLVYNRIRFREFMLRFELDKNRAMLAESNEKLKELDQIKNRFFANISHELRTPLTLLLSPLETMMHSRTHQIDEKARGLMSIMHGNGMRLLKLINDLLDLVRLESGRMEVKHEPVEMNAFLRGIMGAAQQMADQKGLKLETNIQPDLGPLMVDRDKLEKTLLNLVFNALKFTPKGGTVCVRVQRNSDLLALEVEDTGVGISEKNLAHVFDRFWQADNSSKRKYQGVGIGLSLVKELTEVQGGSVAVKSQEGKGTTFTVILPFLKADAVAVGAKEKAVAQPPEPVAPQPDAAASAATAPTGQSEEWLTNLYRRAELFPSLGSTTANPDTTQISKPSANGEPLVRLLVADDEPDMLRFLASQLEGHYQVIQAVDGGQAVELATKHLPEIILLDMNMPEKDGLQVCRELRAQASTAEIPIIILTARADEQTKLSSLSAGADDFLCKPFSTSELHVRVKNLVESHQYKLKLGKQNQVLATMINQLKETETLLVQTEKMASLGRMSAGIMHEINNPLNYASTGLYSLRNKVRFLAPEQQNDYQEVLHDIEEGIARVKHIVTDLNSFTHPDLDRRDEVEVVPVMTSALRFLSSEWKDRVAIARDIPENLVIHANRNKVLQVFVNMLQNSLDAVRRKPFAPGEKPQISLAGRVENGTTVVTIRDNGEGMDAGTMAKVFDPFFTTKDVGEGMGLGLTICYRIIKEYDGRVTVNSELGKFTEFRIEFPQDSSNQKAPQKNAEPAMK